MKALSLVIALLFLSFNITFAASAHHPLATEGNSHQPTAYVGDSGSDSEEEEITEEKIIEVKKSCNHQFRYS